MNKVATELTDTGERMIPAFHKGKLMYAEHQTRYMSAQEIVKDKVVLDIACGSGYGTKLLAEKARKVYGVDIEADAVAYAEKHYSASNTIYRVGSGVAIPVEDASIDVVITFETIEHVEDYKKFIKEVKRVLKPDGLAIVSTPNDLEFAEGNHFHLHEFELEELKGLLKEEFKNIDDYFQATWKYVAIGSKDILESDGTMAVPTVNMAPLSIDKSLYFYLLCSNRTITEVVQPLGALGEHYSDRTLMAQDFSYKLQLEQASLAKQETEKKLASQLDEAKNELSVLKHELNSVKTSRSYKLARKMANLKGRILS